MKMTKITLGFSILATAGLLVVGCNKKANVAPEADTEFQSSIDASYATAVVTEIDDICGYLGEGYTTANASYFSNAGSSGSVVYSQPSASVVAISYIGTVTCMDGKKRSGTVTLDYSASSASTAAKYYRDAGFVGKVLLSNYVVDGWAVNNSSTFTITNTTASGYPPASTPLTWKLAGNIYLTYASGTVTAADSITWKGSLAKTLTNSTNSLVLATSKLLPIKWTVSTSTASPGAKCTYKGTIMGVVSKTKAYTLEVKEGDDNLLVRDFSCSPNKEIITPTYSVLTSEWHPIIIGVSNFTIAGATDARVIEYGSATTIGCDNNANVTIKGISYPISLKK